MPGTPCGMVNFRPPNRQQTKMGWTRSRRSPATHWLLVALCSQLAAERIWGHPPRKDQSIAQAPDVTAEEQRLEDAFHTPRGFKSAGVPAKITEGTAHGVVNVAVTDKHTGQATCCRVCVIGADGNYYEPEQNPLSPWSLVKLGNRRGKGPFRYVGWPFYTTGQFSVQVPVGQVKIEVFKGFEYSPVSESVSIQDGETRFVEIALSRSINIEDFGYVGGDTHIHLDRITDEDDERILDLMQAEDIRHGSILCMNDPSTYSGRMDRQLWRQEKGLGAKSARRRGNYVITSGQEYRCETYGHICLLMHDRLVLDGLTVDPSRWPVFGLVGEETRSLGGFAFHAHGGYSQEILADFAQRTTDGVELLQFAEYRGIGLEGWYHILNAGFHFPAVGASDYPYCRFLGDCRTYVHKQAPQDPLEWTRGAAEGKSFITTGPMLLVKVSEHGPGAIVRLNGGHSRKIPVSVRVRCEVTPVSDVQLIVNGRIVDQAQIPAEQQLGTWFNWEPVTEFDQSSWVAVRAYSKGFQKLPDAEAHSNPVWLIFDEREPYQRESVEWLLTRLNQRIEELSRREFAEQEMALKYFEESRKRLLKLIDDGGLAAPRPTKDADK